MFLLKEVVVDRILSINELTIAPHKITCIVGPSGSGKTTLIRLLNDLHSPSKGLITYNGNDIREYDPTLLRREIVMLQQSPIVFDGSIKDNLLIGMQFAQMEFVGEKELKRALQLVHLEKELEQEATDLSGGEKQRLCLARVLLMKPNVLLLDEPTSALDEATADVVMKNIIRYRDEENCTIVMISHTSSVVELVDEVIDLGKYNNLAKGAV